MDMFIVWLIAIGICSLPFWIFVTITGHEKHLAIAVVVLAGLGAMWSNGVDFGIWSTIIGIPLGLVIVYFIALGAWEEHQETKEKKRVEGQREQWTDTISSLSKEDIEFLSKGGHWSANRMPKEAQSRIRKGICGKCGAEVKLNGRGNLVMHPQKGRTWGCDNAWNKPVKGK